MNVDFYNILDKFGTNKKAIRRLFTSLPDHLTADTEPEWEKHKAKMEEEFGTFDKKEEKKFKRAFIEDFYNKKKTWMRRIQDRIEEGRYWSLKNYRFYMVADLAWDSVPIIPEDIPLQLYAQGRIDMGECYSQLNKCVGDSITQDDLDKMFVKDPDSPENIKSLNLPRLHEVSVNLIRSMVRRRVAAQANKYNDLYPYYQYESRPKDMVSKLRADVLSQRVDVITDQYDYRSEFTQDLRKTFLYSHAISFVSQAWDRERQYRMLRTPAGDLLQDDEEIAEQEDIQEFITKEGVKFHSPHPTRVFHDTQHSLSSINTDKGIKYLGYWDVVRWRDIGDNPMFFNRSAVKFSDSAHYTSFANYFAYYYHNCYACNMKFPNPVPSETEESNKRDTNTGVYSGNHGDEAVWVTNYYEKVIPKEVGLGNYPHPVWVRLVVASDTTIVYGEILPSIPASYMGHDEDHSKILNQSMAHEIIPYNDQVKNLFSQALYLMKIQSLLVMAVDTDTLNEEQIEHIRDLADGSEYYSKMLMIEHSQSDDEENFDRPMQARPPISLVQAQSQIGSVIADLLNNVTNVIGLLEKTQMMSPQESGSFANGERVTAQEVNEVSQTTNSLFSFISEGPDQYRAAKKKILHESLMALGSKDINVYVQERYPDEVIDAAGFKARLGSTADGYELADKDKQSITGKLKDLSFEVQYNSRDGSKRTISSESAKVIGDLTRYVFSTPDIFQIFVDQFGIEQITNMISEVFRLSGAGFILKVPPTSESRQSQITSLISQLEEAMQQNAQQQSEASQQMQGQIQELQTALQTLLAQQNVAGTAPQFQPTTAPAPSPQLPVAGTGGAPVEIPPQQTTAPQPPTVLQPAAP